LFWSTAELADNFDSDDVNGEGATHFIRVSPFVGSHDLAEADLRTVANALLPQAMKSTAELYALFWDATHPPSVSATRLTTDRSTNIVLGFTDRMKASSFSSSTVTVQGSQSGSHPSTLTYNDAARELTIDPQTDFRDGEVVTISVTTGATDRFDNGVDGNGDGTTGPSFTTSFTVAAPRLEVSRTTIDLFGSTQSVSSDFTISNSGTATLAWTIGGTGNGLSVSSGSGSLGAGGSQPITVTASPSMGTTQRTLTVSDGTSPVGITVNTRFTSTTPTTT